MIIILEVLNVVSKQLMVKEIMKLKTLPVFNLKRIKKLKLLLLIMFN